MAGVGLQRRVIPNATTNVRLATTAKAADESASQGRGPGTATELSVQRLAPRVKVQEIWPPSFTSDTASRMYRRCEVCASATAGVAPEAGRVKLRRLLVGTRIVALCERHAQLASMAHAAELPELRALFPEPNGRRSLLPRRSPLDRRVFPPRPEGRRASSGRRWDDID